MADERRPRVAVIGGFYDLDRSDPALGQAARAYAQELGRALARAGFGLVVYFSDDKSLEPHVVSGFVAALPADVTDAVIDVRYSIAQQGQVAFPEQATRPALFNRKLFAGQEWEAPFYRSLAARDSVDAVLLMAGGNSTLNAGQVAVGRGLPLLAIDRFPGSTLKLFVELAQQQPDYPSANDATPDQLMAWLKRRQAREAVRHRQEEADKLAYASLLAQQRGLAWLTVAALALVATLAFGVGLADTPKQFLAALCATLVVGGATGALTRGVTSTSIKLVPRLACLLGMLAGVLVGLACLIPQFVGAHGPLEPGASGVSATDRIQLMSVLVVAFTAGIGFDAIFRRMLQEADKLPVKP